MADAPFEKLTFESFEALCRWYIDMVDNGRLDDYSFSVTYGECRAGGEAVYCGDLEFAGTTGAPPEIDVPEAQDGTTHNPDLGRLPYKL